MPQYNGSVFYLIEVLVHLLHHYVAWLFVYAIVLPAPFVIWAAFNVGIEEAVRPWLQLSVGTPVWWFAMAHWMTFLEIPYYVRARFPYAPPYLTVAIAALAGTVLLGFVWTAFGVAWPGDSVLSRFQWAGLVTIGAAALGMIVLKLGGTGALHWGLGRWIGWFLVGRTAFEAFLATDAERLKSEYDAYANSVRRRQT